MLILCLGSGLLNHLTFVLIYIKEFSKTTHWKFRECCKMSSGSYESCDVTRAIKKIEGRVWSARLILLLRKSRHQFNGFPRRRIQDVAGCLIVRHDFKKWALPRVTSCCCCSRNNNCCSYSGNLSHVFSWKMLAKWKRKRCRFFFLRRNIMRPKKSISPAL